MPAFGQGMAAFVAAVRAAQRALAGATPRVADPAPFEAAGLPQPSSGLMAAYVAAGVPDALLPRRGGAEAEPATGAEPAAAASASAPDWIEAVATLPPALLALVEEARAVADAAPGDGYRQLVTFKTVEKKARGALQQAQGAVKRASRVDAGATAEAAPLLEAASAQVEAMASGLAAAGRAAQAGDAPAVAVALAGLEGPVRALDAVITPVAVARQAAHAARQAARDAVAGELEAQVTALREAEARLASRARDALDDVAAAFEDARRDYMAAIRAAGGQTSVRPAVTRALERMRDALDDRQAAQVVRALEAQVAEVTSAAGKGDPAVRAFADAVKKQAAALG